MQDLYAQKDKALGPDLVFAVAVTGNADEQHSGVFYRDPTNGTLFLLHLTIGALNNDNAALGVMYLWGEPGLPLARRRDLANKALLINNESGKSRIPYGFSLPKGFFNQNTGARLFGKEKVGLTCATLVLAIFHMIGIELLDYRTWRERPGDKDRQKNLLKKLQTFKAEIGLTDDHLKEVEAQVDGLRYRPPEVVAAALTGPEITTIDQLEPLGEEIIKKIVAANKKP